MLTKSDLKSLNQTVRKAIKEEAVTKNEAKSFVRKEDLENFVTKDDLKPIKQDLAKIRKDMSTITDFFDKEYLDLRNRVERIEEHLGLLPQN